MLRCTIGDANLTGSVPKEIAIKKNEESKQLRREKETQDSEIHFLKSSASNNKEILELMFHQTTLIAEIAKSNIEHAIKKSGPTSPAFNDLSKALLNVSKIHTIACFASRANFKLKTSIIKADLAAYIKEYILNFASTHSAQLISTSVKYKVNEPYITNFKPIDIAIIIDNIASNSHRADAKKIIFTIYLDENNELCVHAQDNGKGLPSEIQPPEKIFNQGVTTTSGSGLGLFHIKQTVDAMKGRVEIDPNTKTGFSLKITLPR